MQSNCNHRIFTVEKFAFITFDLCGQNNPMGQENNAASTACLHKEVGSMLCDDQRTSAVTPLQSLPVLMERMLLLIYTCVVMMFASGLNFIIV